MKKMLLGVATAAMLTATTATAGDTITINIPGGATQTVSLASLSAALSSQSLANTTVAGITQNANGTTTITLSSGVRITLSSAFLVRIVSMYLAGNA